MTNFVISFSGSLAPWHVFSRRQRAITFCALTASTVFCLVSQGISKLPGLFSTVTTPWFGLTEAGAYGLGPRKTERHVDGRSASNLAGLDHWLKEVAATDVVLYERWMNNEIMVRSLKLGNCLVHFLRRAGAPALML